MSPARLAALALPLSCALPWSAQAQSSSSALKETVVTATRVAQPLSDLVADVSIIDRETIERSGVTGVADVLARVPGIEISRNGGPGTTTSVFVRGAESRFTAVYIDGIRIDTQSTGGAAWESIPLALIDRIEVLRGPAAAVYGSDALGGVIQLFTKKGEGAFAPYVGLGLGSLGTRRLEAGFSGSQGDFDYSVGVARDSSDGFNARPIPTMNPDRDGFRSTSGNARLGLRLSPTQKLDATLLANDLNSQYDNSLKLDDRNHHKLQAMGLNWQSQWSEVWSSKVSVSESRELYETTPSPYLSITRLRNYLFQNEIRLGAHLVTAALERREDRLENAPIDRKRSQDALALGYGYTYQQHTVQVNLRHDQDSEFGGKNTGSLAYGYAFAPGWRATASVGNAFRAPTLYQRFSIYGVSSLRPESSRNVEFGLRYAQGSSSFGVVAYRNRVSDLISFVGAGTCQSSFGCYANTARAEYEGMTFSGGYQLAGVSLRASLDVQNPRDLDTGKQLARRSRQHATLGADTRVGNWLLGAEAQLSGKRYDNVANTTVLGGYSLINLSASTRLAKDWTLLARVDNLADKTYQLANTYATAGRTLYVGLKWAPQ
ncbi:TonB-dependent receptor domain-containing protein [Variovorax terrae]|uniref:TonB-dependent receptor n=1 Tax=Variovorax terrae TaxID=2923278 RepID=A0A9X2AM55_9BURK|nr:TonB-dependent receptor [Variovorax terrae]MCJ0762934.1 TonB-dependent receptor [Variovorax terrae]